MYIPSIISLQNYSVLTLILTLLPTAVPRFTTSDLCNCNPIKMYKIEITVIGNTKTKTVEIVKTCLFKPSGSDRARLTVHVSCLVMPTSKIYKKIEKEKVGL